MVKRTKGGRVLNCHLSMPHHAVETLELTHQELPKAVDLRPQDTPIFDQGQQGSCTANAGCGLYDFLRKGKVLTSRDFSYYAERVIDGTVSQDAGSSLATCTQSFLRYGSCLEKTWPYGQNDLYQAPPDEAWTEAGDYKITRGLSIAQNLQAVKESLANGFPVIYGMSIYESFEDAPNGVIPMPGRFEQLMGGHALMFVGYDDETEMLLGRNSWGESWGDKGYFHLPYAYAMNRMLASDFWTFRL